MHKPHSWVWAAAIMMAATRPAYAQEWASAVREDSTLRALVAEAVQRNPGLAQGQAGYRAATLRIRPAGALSDPMLSVGGLDLVLPGLKLGQDDLTENEAEPPQEPPRTGN